MSQVIHDEVSLASKEAQHEESKLQAMERKKASKYRSSSMHFQNELTQEQVVLKQRAARKLIR